MPLGHGAGPKETQMWVLSLVSPCEGPTSGDVDDPWWQPTPTWREEVHKDSYGGCLPKWKVEVIGVPARGMPLMDPSVSKFSYIPSINFSGWHSLPRTLESFASLWLEEPTSEQLLVLRPVVIMGSKAYMSSSVEWNNGRYKRCPNVGNLEKAEAEGSHGGGREMSPGECWFTMETSLVEHQDLF